jgi:hypothetical protein
MKIVGVVGGEGGPLLIIDARAAYRWGGIDTNDYDRACELFDNDEQAEGMEVEVGDGHGLLWELKGPGVAYIVYDETLICLIRMWIDEDVDELDAVLDFSKKERSHDAISIGRVMVDSQKIAVMWATENGSAIQSALDLGVARDNRKTSIDDASIVFDIDKTVCEGLCDTVKTKYGEARRLFLI